MKVKIWSDVRCPFCYIGKRKFEAALEQFSHRDQIEVEWKSFELDPYVQTDPEVQVMDQLIAQKNLSREQANQMMNHVTQSGRQVGLELKVEESVLANSYNAHRLIQLAKTRGLGSEIEEALFKAHFTDGANIDDRKVLTDLGLSIGLDESELNDVLSSETYGEAVRQDQAEAQALGIRGVPFFVFNDKYAVSGAQPEETFLGALQQSWEDHQKTKQPFVIEAGPSCSVDGDCI